MAAVKFKPVLSVKKSIKTRSNGKAVQKESVQYKEGLEPKEKERYEKKLGLIKGQDPYEIITWSTDTNILPEIGYRDIINFLVFTPSPYTAEDLQCFKGLDAYNQFVSGWVRETASCTINGKHVTTAKVLHSQRLSEPPLRPWVIAEKNGRVLASHCTCMAGCGETCTHVAALLFYIETAVNIRNSKTVTEEKAYWKMPAAFKGPSYSKLNDINFCSAKTMKKKLDANVSDEQQPLPKQTTRKTFSVPGNDRLTNFFKDLSSAPSKPAILSMQPAYSDKYVPTILKDGFPSPLTNLKDSTTLSMDYASLIKQCDKIEVNLSEEQIELVEVSTRDQAKSRLWQQYRAGRITASKMRTVCHTNQSSPALSLITGICYPMAIKFQTKATEWGCAHEKLARELFAEQMATTHQNATVETCGLFISEEYSFIGASPDAIFSCDCCGKSTVEIKCPFCQRDKTLDEAASDKKFCLNKDDEGNLHLDIKHEYYYQVQTQLGVCGVELGYFVVWTEKDIHVETILFDDTFWAYMCSKATNVFKNAILPELVGKFFTRPDACDITNSLVEEGIAPERDESFEAVNQETDSDNDNNVELWCYCRDVEHGEMICCDNSLCKIEWFHQDCLKIKSAPKGKWFCPDCKKSASKKKSALKSK